MRTLFGPSDMAAAATEDVVDVAAAPHVVFFPLPVKGHLNPYLSIAHHLSSHGVSVTFVHGPSSTSFPCTPSLHFSVIPELDLLLPPTKPPLPPPPPLADNSATHIDADHHQNISTDRVLDFSPSPLKVALQNLLRRLFDPLQSQFRPPSCIFTEGFFPWTQDVALQFGLSRVEIWTLSASVFSIVLHFPEVSARGHAIPVKLGSPEAEEMVDFIPGVPPMCLKDLPFILIGDSDTAREFVMQALERCKEADRVLVNTFYELEGEAIDVLREKAGVRIEAVGPLVATTGLPRRLTGPGEEEDTACLGWLDTRRKHSVVYLSFGSLAALPANAVQELALGLEASGQAFLWVLRPGSLDGQTLLEVLPEGFQERTEDRGLIVSWAPQVDILAHPAAGSFVTHCGWNSTTEALAAGVPMIGLPLIAEQNTNLRFLADVWRVAIRLMPDYHCPVSKEAVEECVRSVMTGTQGVLLRERSIALGKLARQSAMSKESLRQLVNDLHFGTLGCRRILI